MERVIQGKLLIKLIFVLTLVLLSSASSLQAATSPDAIAFRVMPNPNYLSPLRWYQENIKVKGSPQALIIDGYEAVRDGRTVYVNAANISGADFYTNIYIISYNQQAENATVDIFGQILSHWKFNTNFSTAGSCVQPDKYLNGSCLIDSDCLANEYCDSQKAKITRDTKRLSDLAEIKSILSQFKTQSGYYPQLASGSYLANISMSVWPSWKNTLASDLKSTLPIDPLNRLGLCDGYDKTTCWNAVTKKFAGADSDGDGQLDLPSCSFVYIYTATAAASYNICAVMESGLTTLAQGACTGSAAYVGHGATCTDTTWTPNYIAANVCQGQRITQTSNCGRTRVLTGAKIPTNPNCAANTCVGQTCNTGCAIVNGAKTDGDCCVVSSWSPNTDPATVCSGTSITQTSNCGTTRTIDGSKCCVTCNNNTTDQPNCRSGAPANSQPGTGVCCSNQTCYSCATGYYYDSSSSSCRSNTLTGGGTCGAKPANTAWWDTSSNAGKFTQTYNGADWLPTTKASSYSANTTSTECAFKCAANFTWNSTSLSCAANTQTVDCTVKPANTSWNGSATILQTWNGSAWQPSNVSSHNATTGACHFICAPSSYNWNGSACIGCGDGIVSPGEQCDPNDIDPSTGKARTQACQDTITPGVAWCPTSFVTNGTRSCKNDCSGWNTCNTEIIDNTSLECDSSNETITDYTCCVLISCGQDGCACCGSGAAAITPGFTNVKNMDSTWNLSMSKAGYWWCYDGNACTGSWADPPPPAVPTSRCWVGREFASANDTCSSCSDKLYNSSTYPIGACKLNQDLPYAGHTGNPKNWTVTTNHSSAYYKCWK